MAIGDRNGHIGLVWFESASKSARLGAPGSSAHHGVRD